MKAERRHELQTNTLAQFISDLPLYLRFHANKILIGIIAICLLILLVRYRMNATQQAREATHSSLVSAQLGIDQLKVIDRAQPNDMARAQERRKLAGQINAAIQQILDNTKDPDDSTLRADALIAKGDLNWTLANLPALPDAATQPALAMPQSNAEYLDTAQAAYQQVLKNYPTQNFAKADALLGLAAIEENRSNWDKAGEYYDNIAKDQTLASAFKDVALRRKQLLEQLRMPVYLGSYSSTQPASPTATTAPSVPSTLPAAPTSNTSRP